MIWEPCISRNLVKHNLKCGKVLFGFIFRTAENRWHCSFYLDEGRSTYTETEQAAKSVVEGGTKRWLELAGLEEKP